MEVQTSQMESLIEYMVKYVKAFYHQHYNPLGLIDDTILKIKGAKYFPQQAFEEFYHDLAAIYRFKHGEVQLEFLFDGRTHFDKYTDDWDAYFRESIRSFCYNKVFIRAVLDISVFHNKDHVAFLAGGRLKHFLASYFDLKVYKYRGIVERKAS